MSPKITTGLNDRPKDTTIAQTGAGLPDDTGKPLEISEDEAKRIEQGIRNMGQKMPTGPDVPYDVETKQSKPNPQEQLKSDVQENIDLPLKGSA